ncbi:hypothetical protein AVEN_32165-1 [Araneus ventricosus]|uniref:Uncharacterized protein n=1 Tax=Araneus ventricosus TaxID=182803 RepID=A0A4Y2GSU2_ARAVE|nr:hypothetical protein AVEN_32165-1 [Araneus ventricosus]
MENNALFTNILENLKHKYHERTALLQISNTNRQQIANSNRKHFHYDSDSTLSIALGVYQFTSSHCGQNFEQRFQRRSHSKEDRTSKGDLTRFQSIRNCGYLQYYRHSMTSHGII